MSTGQGNDYTTSCLLDFAYFKNNFKLIEADLRKQKVLDANPRAIQQIIFTGKASEETIIYYAFKKNNNNFPKEQKMFCKYI